MSITFTCSLCKEQVEWLVSSLEGLDPQPTCLDCESKTWKRFLAALVLRMDQAPAF